MTIEEKEKQIIEKYGFQKTNFPDSYLLDDLMLWVDDKIHLYVNNQISFRQDLTIENLERLEKYLDDLALQKKLVY